jgi:hypothetical protein
MLVPILSLSTLESDDEDRLAAELGLARLRSQLAVIRTLADHIEHLARPQDTDGLGHQIVEEMARLGCRLIEAAASLTQSPRSDESGVFERRGSSA